MPRREKQKLRRSSEAYNSIVTDYAKHSDNVLRGLYYKHQLRILNVMEMVMEPDEVYDGGITRELKPGDITEIEPKPSFLTRITSGFIKTYGSRFELYLGDGETRVFDTYEEAEGARVLRGI